MYKKYVKQKTQGIFCCMFKDLYFVERLKLNNCVEFSLQRVLKKSLVFKLVFRKQ